MIEISDILSKHRHKEGALLPILHDVQGRLGKINETAIREIAAALNLTRAEVYGVVSFYHDFHSDPKDQKALKLCTAEACQARGVKSLLDGVSERARERIAPVYCLGLCSVGPAALTSDGEVHARLAPDQLARLVDDA